VERVTFQWTFDPSHFVHKIEAKCFNSINKNRYVKHQCSNGSGAVPKNLQFTENFLPVR
jgi:hypothetical protein